MTHVIQASSKTSPSPSLSAFLQQAIEEGDLYAMQTLLKQGSPVNTPLPSKEIPLHAAVRSARFATDKDKIEAIKLLIQSGADLDAKDIYHLTALDHAIHLQNMPLAKTILSEKIGIASEKIESQVGVKHSFADAIEQLNQKVAVDSKALGPLQKASYEGDLEKLQQATASAQNRASIRRRIDRLDQHGLAPIHYAVLGNKAAAFQSLLKLGADPKVLTRNKDSILHLAAIKKSPSLLQLALECKVDINHQNSQGETALYHAFLQEHWIGIQTLVQKGADPFITDFHGISPPAAFMSISLQKDPLLLSVKDAAHAIFGTLFLWQLGSHNFASLSNFRSWSPAFAASFFGFFGVQAIPPKKHEKISAISSIAKEFLPVLGLGWTAKKTYHSLSSSFQMVKRGWEYLGYRNRDALQNIAVGSVSAIAGLALFGAQSAVQLGMILPYTENPLPQPIPPLATILAQQGSRPEEIAEILKTIYPVSIPGPSPISTATPSPTLLTTSIPTPTPTPIPPTPAPILSQSFPAHDPSKNPILFKELTTNKTVAITAQKGNTSKEIAEILKPIYPVFAPTPSPNSNPALVLNRTPTHQPKIADRSQRPRYLIRKNDMPISNEELPQENPNHIEINSTNASDNLSISMEISADDDVKFTGLTSNILSSVLDLAYSCYQVSTRVMKISAYFALSVGTIIFVGKKWMPNRYRLWIDMTGDRNLLANQNEGRIKINPLSIINDLKKIGTQAITACFNYIRFQFQTNPSLKNTKVGNIVRAPSRVITQLTSPKTPHTPSNWVSQSLIFSPSSGGSLPVLTPLMNEYPGPSEMQAFIPAALAIGTSITSSLLPPPSLSPLPLAPDENSPQAPTASSQASTASFSEQSFQTPEASAVNLFHVLSPTSPSAHTGSSSQQQPFLKKEEVKESDASPRPGTPSSEAFPVLTPASGPSLMDRSPVPLEIQAFNPAALAIGTSITSSLLPPPSLSPLPLAPDENSPQAPTASSQASTASFSQESFQTPEASPYTPPRPTSTRLIVQESHPTESEGPEDLDDPREDELPPLNSVEEVASNEGWYQWLWTGNSNNPQQQPSREPLGQQIPSPNPGQEESSSGTGLSRWWYGS